MTEQELMKEQETQQNKLKQLRHLGIVLDGNRRFAKKLMLEPWRGHELGAEKIEKLFDWCKELGIKEITLYCFSLENFNRPKKEFDFLMKIFKKEFSKLKQDKRVHENRIKIRFVGKIELFDKEIQRLAADLQEMTKDYNDYIINFAFAYGGRQEIVDAVKKLAESREEINEKNLQKNLWLSDDIDLIIRTGGEKRTSNFLPWQATYAEWIFLDKLWPEFTKQDLIECIEEFKNRERRFGK
jgi:tritrans,polycis-undecaprenyl-diphosphate synthase [geranylgeranyl-diphosphate specific]